VVRRLREGARRNGGHQNQEVRGLRPEGAQLRAAGERVEEAVVRPLRSLRLRMGTLREGQSPSLCNPL
jgi:hypothetical protein